MKKTGRPSVYHDSYPDKVQHYIDNYKEVYDDNVPMVAGLARILDVSRETIYAWDKSGDYPKFSDMLRKMQTAQERALANKGLDGTFNAPITKLMMHKHGYSDKVEQENTGDTTTKIVYVDSKEKNALENHIADIVEDAD